MSLIALEPKNTTETISIPHRHKRRQGLRQKLRHYLRPVASHPLASKVHHNHHTHPQYPQAPHAHKLAPATNEDKQYLHYNCGHTKAIPRPRQRFMHRLKQFLLHIPPPITFVNDTCPDCARFARLLEIEKRRANQGGEVPKMDTVEVVRKAWGKEPMGGMGTAAGLKGRVLTKEERELLKTRPEETPVMMVVKVDSKAG